jgi:hypothetical protein
VLDELEAIAGWVQPGNFPALGLLLGPLAGMASDLGDSICLSAVVSFAWACELEPPFGPAHFIALTNYIALLIPTVNAVPQDLLGRVVVAAAELIFADVAFSCDRQSLVEIFDTLTSRHAARVAEIVVVPAVVCECIKSGDRVLLSTAGNLLQYAAPELRGQLYRDAIAHFREIIGAARMRPEAALPFISSMRLDGCPDVRPVIADFLVEIGGACQKPAAVFTEFCSASIRALGPETFPMLWQWREKLLKPQNAVIVIEAAEGMELAAPVCEFCLEANEAAEENEKATTSKERLVLNKLASASVRFLLPIIQEMPPELVIRAITCINEAIFRRSLPDACVHGCICAYAQLERSLFTEDLPRFAKAFEDFLESVQSDGDDLRAFVADWTRFVRSIAEVGPPFEVGGWAAELLDGADEEVPDKIELMFSRFGGGDLADDEAWEEDADEI